MWNILVMAVLIRLHNNLTIYDLVAAKYDATKWLCLKEKT